ncbi:MAG: hypothetical protein WCS01_13565 [bacterium]
MRLDLPKLHRRSLCCCAWLLVAASLGAERALAEEASTNDQPTMVNAIAEPDAEVNNWLNNACAAVRGGLRAQRYLGSRVS